ncbi:MAG TPA: site-specific integrase, partial [Myxococcota bacterium]|nr:site-specific integrase [Myxococcota bacterium]
MEHRSNTPSNRNAASRDWEGQLDAAAVAPGEEPPTAVVAAVDGLTTEDLPVGDADNGLAEGVTVSSEPDAQALASVLTVARGYAEDSMAANTRRAYRADWRIFETWCDARGLAPLPASGDTVALYLADRAAAGRKASSIGRSLTAIVQAHLGASHASPRSAAVKAVLQGIRRRHGSAPAQKAALSLEELRRMVEPLSDRPIDVRDRALLLLGFAGALRRSEVVGLDWHHLTDDRDGLRLRLVRSKTDQEGQGRVVGIPFGGRPGTCPVRALRA